MQWTIPRCYDSHTHLLATGVVRKGLNLFDLQSADDVAKLRLEPHHFRGDWLVGFGWDQSKWSNPQLPTKEVLDRVFPDFPVAFSRADGHATWLNSKALEVSGYLNRTETERPPPLGSQVVQDLKGYPTGIFSETVKFEVESMIPAYTQEQNKIFLFEAIRYFNSRGFTHLRDMSGFMDQWNLLRELDLSGDLSLYVEENFTCENVPDFERALREAQAARDSETTHLKVRGIKFYFDGSLGSQGALLSQFYPGTSQKGLQLWDLEDVAVVIEKTWKAGFEICCHTIGDEACHLILQTAAKVKATTGLNGIINIEHAEVIRPETIQLMRGLSVVCHLQPCHWLTDRRWLLEKLGDLYQYAFPWQALEQADVTMQWGSDSPIEEASVANNLEALSKSSLDGIPALKRNPVLSHSHRHSDWGANCESVFENGNLKKFVFDGQTKEL